MAEVTTEEISNVEEQQLVKVFGNFIKKIKRVVDEIPKSSPKEKTLNINGDRLDIFLYKQFTSGRFSFWGGLVDPSSYPEVRNLKNNIPTIKNIHIPEKLWGQGLGQKVVKSWEESFREKGLLVFAITNIKPDAIKFWQKQGYFIPEGENDKDWPHHMFKIFRPSSGSS